VLVGSSALGRDAGSVGGRPLRLAGPNAVAAALLLYLLFGWPLLYMGYAYGVGPAIPFTWLAVLLEVLVLRQVLARPGAGRAEFDMGVLGAALLYAWVTSVILLARDVRIFAPFVYTDFLTKHVVLAGALLLVGIRFPRAMAALRSPWGRRSAMACAGCLGLGVVLASWLNPGSVQLPWYFLGIPTFNAEGTQVNYLFVSDFLAIAALLVLSQVRSFWIRALIAVAGGVLLFWTQSRAALAAFSVVAVVILLVHWFRLRLWLRLLAAAVLLPLLFVLFTQLRPVISEVGPVGELQRFDVTQLQSDPSLQSREEVAAQGMFYLRKHWVLGHFMGEVLEGRQGNYIHNWLSFWDEYGLGPFVIFILLYAAALFRITSAYASEPNRPELEFLFGLSWMVGISIVVARSYGSQQVWLVLTAVPATLAATRRKARLAPAQAAPAKDAEVAT